MAVEDPPNTDIDKAKDSDKVKKSFLLQRRYVSVLWHPSFENSPHSIAFQILMNGKNHFKYNNLS